MTYSDLFRDCWDEQVKDRMERSPSFAPEEYVATGRAGKEYGGKRNTQWWFDNGPGMVQSWVDWRAETGWAFWEVGGKPAIELECNFMLPGLDLPIKAFIDRVFVLPTGEMAVLDLKTGRTPEVPEQLGLYATAIEVVHGIRPRWGYFWSPDKGHGSPYDLDMWDQRFFSLEFNEAIRGINAGAFLPQPANNCKAWCGVARFCHAVGGAEAPGNDPLAPILTIATREGQQ